MEMTTKFGSCAKLLLVCLMFACVFEVSVGRTYTVGDSFGWQTPPAGALTFSNWANQQTFVVGDILEFNFNSGVHTATKVNKNDFDSCNAANPIDDETNGPARFTLDTTGDYYFICTIHCNQGQKLMVNVTSADSPSGSPSPGSSPATPGGNLSPPPSGSVSTRLAASASFVILVPIVITATFS
ncbi:umecyanin-like [Nicotiana tabacum]|uniref:Umecyanin-like n=2 Tax=Nicotiana TaxID=4085 RepID=A0A1S4DG97_TOBAC|nr:PREDICTED: umecyanin-like [Nicotiana sylvestris]XP_016512390.1 PREDICTED: umecyanin-like [Nicotiana tabacum]